MKWALYSVAAVLVAVVLYGVGVEPRLLLDDVALEVQLPGLPDGWDGKTLGLVGDFQIGMWLDNDGMVEEAIEDAIEDRVDALLVAGDFVYKPDSARVREAVGLVRPALEAGIPVVAVLGNHDYSLMQKPSETNHGLAAYLAEQLRAAGVRVLQNEITPLVAGGDSLWIAGVGSTWAGMDDVDATLAQLPEGAPRVWLMHNPEAFRRIPGEAAHLALAAHTHGGQIRILPGRRNSWLDIVRPGEVAADGWAAVSIGAPPNRIYINRGIGFSGVPIRINCRPELTLITLRVPTGRIPSRGPGAADVTDGYPDDYPDRSTIPEVSDRLAAVTEKT